MTNPFMMKRAREDFDHHVTTVANGLMLLSAAASDGGGNSYLTMSSGDLCSRVFECKTCNRQFSSFQALGGHRASHKRPRMMTAAAAAGEPVALLPPSSPPKPKTHECSICGLEFAIGQALGGHMRRHRAAGNDVSLNGGDSLALSPPGGVPVVKKPSSGRRVLCVDLNLTPLENDRLEFIKFGKVA
ncbi:PREDICTED: zinc finger protein ZAT12-like [Ipomoea nil]|uniref:zinc finger protein ZAT12-like n=1 Tax=Ipomoea nil TaxID=35883 RepID=UPI0009016DEF|nr:PREDICTED: zinc finger protein ZAT12-like [Ipomoea nil]